MREWTVVAEGLDHPEGVCTGPDGTVFAGGEAGQLYRVDLADGAIEVVADSGGFLLGMCADADGVVYACDLRRQEVVRMDPRSGEVSVYSTGAPDRPLQTPNWPVFADDGSLFFIDSGRWKEDDGVVFKVAPDGTTAVWDESCRRFPNGGCLSIDGTELFVVESLAPALSAVEIRADGSAGERRVVAELPGSVPDGVVLDADGNAYVCCYRPDRIYKVSPAGDVEVLAEDPLGTTLAAPTNGVFVGTRLVVANLGRWHLAAAELGVSGAPLRHPTVEAR